jgi:hypothetical protein
MAQSGITVLVLALTALGASTLRAADTNPPKVGGAKLVIPETMFDYGYTPQDTKVSHVYWLKNDGTDTLRLADVRPGCGCTKAPLKTNRLPPGDSTDVEVIFSTGKFSGKVHKSASVIVDGPGTELPILEFTASPTPVPDSLRPLTFSPPLLTLDNLGKLQSSPTWDFAVSVRNHSDHDLSIRQVSPSPLHVSVDLPRGAIRPGTDMTLHVKVDPAVADTTMSKSLTFEVSDSSHTRYTLPIVKETRWGPAPAPAH